MSASPSAEAGGASRCCPAGATSPPHLPRRILAVVGVLSAMVEPPSMQPTSGSAGGVHAAHSPPRRRHMRATAAAEPACRAAARRGRLPESRLTVSWAGSGACERDERVDAHRLRPSSRSSAPGRAVNHAVDGAHGARSGAQPASRPRARGAGALARAGSRACGGAGYRVSASRCGQQARIRVGKRACSVRAALTQA